METEAHACIQPPYYIPLSYLCANLFQQQHFPTPTTTVWKSEDSVDGTLAATIHQWRFSLTVPENVPSSFGGRYGIVEYTLKGVIERRKKYDLEMEKTIRVQQILKLITDPTLLQPKHQQVQKSVCCCCCRCGTVVLAVSIPKQKFVMGEKFGPHISVQNGSNRPPTLHALSNRSEHYYASGRHTVIKNALFSLQSDGIDPHTSQDWDPSGKIPCIDIVYCEVIQVKYSFTISAKISGARMLKTEIPIQLEYFHSHSSSDTFSTPGVTYTSTSFKPVL